MTDKEFEMELKKYGFECSNQDTDAYYRGWAMIVARDLEIGGKTMKLYGITRDFIRYTNIYQWHTQSAFLTKLSTMYKQNKGE